MVRRRIALIGNSGMGKSTCVERTGGNLLIASMDHVLGTEQAPTGEAAFEWMLGDATEGHDVLDISVHLELLRQMREAKHAGKWKAEFQQILFVYLHNPNPVSHRARLQSPNAHGAIRSEDAVENAMRWETVVDEVCQDLADVIVVTSRLSVGEVADLVLGLRRAVVP